MVTRLLLVPAAAVSYLVGLALHEMTHVAVAKALQARVLNIQWYPPVVTYEAPSTQVDAIVRCSTVFTALALITAYVYKASTDSPTLWYHALAIAFLAGYVPRSGSDWQPIFQAGSA